MPIQNSELSPSSMNNDYQSVIRANQQLHTALAAFYDSTEPHFRPENLSHVESRLRAVCAGTSARRLLDLGCGTGFIINIAKEFVAEIDGVDVTEAMISRVDRSGDCHIRLHLADTGGVEVEEGTFDVVTAYSFLHHLFDIGPTLRTAAKALRKGGQFYADLDPNFYFWDAIRSLGPAGSYDPILAREILAVTAKDEEIQERFQVDRHVFNSAEYQKNIIGGFREEDLVLSLREAGFARIEIHYYWFLGQALIVNDPELGAADREQRARQFAATLEKGLPLTRPLFKYVGFVATR